MVGTKLTHCTRLASIRRNASSASNFTIPVTRPPAREQSGVRKDKRRVVIERAGIEQRHAVQNSEQRFRGRVDDRRLVIEDYFGPTGRAAAGHRLPVAR